MEDTLENRCEPRPEPQHFAPPEEIVNYYFPVEIVVADRLADQELESIQARIYQDLHDAIIDKLA
jgi:hypothetical protein